MSSFGRKGIGGPVTAQGRATTAKNATTHGLRAATSVRNRTRMDIRRRVPGGREMIESAPREAANACAVGKVGDGSRARSTTRRGRVARRRAAADAGVVAWWRWNLRGPSPKRTAARGPKRAPTPALLPVLIRDAALPPACARARLRLELGEAALVFEDDAAPEYVAALARALGAC